MPIETQEQFLQRMISFVSEKEDEAAERADMEDPGSDEAVVWRREEVNFCRIKGFLEKQLSLAKQIKPVPFG